MSPVRGCVLAAGKGTRMGGDRPKVLAEANGVTLLAWTLGALSDAGVDDVVAVVGFQKEEVIAQLPTGVRWVGQSPQLGTGHAVRCARIAFPDDEGTLLVTCGDMPLVRAATYRALVEKREQENADLVLLTTTVEPDSRFGRVIRDETGRLTRVVEWKDASPEERAVDEGSAGVYAFRAAALWPALERIGNRNAQGEYYLPDVIPLMIAGGGRAETIRTPDPDEAIGVNTPEELARVAELLAERER